jgi:hypothetical protein
MAEGEKLGIISLKTIQRNKINKKKTRAAGDCKKTSPMDWVAKTASFIAIQRKELDLNTR